MGNSFSTRFRGAESLDAVVSATIEGNIDCLVIAAQSADMLSRCARDYLRSLRVHGVQVEFHQKGGVEAVVHTTNRLLADIPVEKLSVSKSTDCLRLLVIDNAESLPVAELQAAQRMARALKGSVFRVVFFWRLSPDSLLPDELQQFLRGAVVWGLDLAVSATPEAPKLSLEPVVSMPTSISTAVTAQPVSEPPLDSVVEKADVLAQLAAERARERGFDATDRSWLQRYRPFATAAVLLAVLVGGTWIFQAQLTVDDRSRVFDCGTYADEATLNVVRERLGRGVPTRVLREQDKWRLQVGPFDGLDAAERHLSQIWAVGPCRVTPMIIQEQKKRG